MSVDQFYSNSNVSSSAVLHSEARPPTCHFWSPSYCRKDLLVTFRAWKLYNVHLYMLCWEIVAKARVLHLNVKNACFLHFWWNTNPILRTGADSDVGLILLDFPQLWEEKCASEEIKVSLPNLKEWVLFFHIYIKIGKPFPFPPWNTISKSEQYVFYPSRLKYHLSMFLKPSKQQVLDDKSLRLQNDRKQIGMSIFLCFSQIYLLVYCSHTREVLRFEILNPY